MAVHTLEHGEFKFPCPTTKNVQCWNLCKVNRLMRLCDIGVIVDKQKPRPPTPSATQMEDIARKNVLSSKQFDSDDDEVLITIIARKSRMM